jgi:hypothetical protein
MATDLVRGMKPQPDVTVELSEKYTDLEIKLHRLAHSKAATEKEAEQAAILLFRSLRRRDARYQVRTLGAAAPKLTVLHQSDSREHNYNAGV